MDNQRIVDDIRRMDRLEHISVFRFILEDGIPYSTNSNGIFIPIQRIPASTMEKILKFIDYSKTTKLYMEKQERQKEEFKEMLRNDIQTETQSFNRYYQTWQQDESPAFLTPTSDSGSTSVEVEA